MGPGIRPNTAAEGIRTILEMLPGPAIVGKPYRKYVEALGSAGTPPG